MALYNSTYARKLGVAYHEWQFCASASAGLLIAERDGAIQGVFGYRLNTMSPEGDLRTALGLDMIVEPGSRGRGRVFASLTAGVERACASEGAKALLVFPNRRGASAWASLPEWRVVGEQTTYTAPSRPRLVAGSLEVEPCESFGDWVSDVVTAFDHAHPTLASVRRDAAYLNWRFTTHPVYRYDILRVDLDAKPFGYLVLKAFTDPQTGAIEGDIVDLLWGSDDEEVLREMLDVALAHFAERGISGVNAWLDANTALARVGSDLGFKARDQRRTVLIRILDPAGQWLADRDRWFFTMADSELY